MICLEPTWADRPLIRDTDTILVVLTESASVPYNRAIVAGYIRRDTAPSTLSIPEKTHHLRVSSPPSQLTACLRGQNGTHHVLLDCETPMVINNSCFHWMVTVKG